MQSPPRELDQADVIYWVVLRAEQTWTGQSRHYNAYGLVDPVPALAICQYRGEKQAYLFLCDACWNVLQDDLFESVEEALEQASLQYTGLHSDDWTKAG